MKTKLLMISSAVFLLGLGVLFTFAPSEVLGSIGSLPQPALVLVLQATGALYLGFAILNWMAKDNLLGGIYSRPVALGNFLHFAAFAIAVLKAGTGNHRDTRLVFVALMYALFAVWFGLVTFGSPVRPAEP